ncbi:DUF2946 family protein [Novosphingobium sp.]|uniref:DUF2946 family protein n=1 Tax=Novosphingobium sp. TaxID=1874826 RepID=UPI00333F6688
MTTLRALLLRHRALAFGLLALALVMKALVPAGMMVGSDSRILTVQICDGYADAAHAVVIAVKGQPHSDKAAPDHQACPFASLVLAGLGGADPIQLVLALVFAIALGLAAAPAPVARRLPHLRPPLRGPPLPA